MDVSAITSLSTAMANERTEVALGVAVLKKSMDLQSTAAEALIEAIPPLPANPNIGRNINTTA